MAKKGMTREEATELYQDLRKAMGTLKSRGGTASKAPVDKEVQEVAKTIAASISQSMAKESPSRGRPSASAKRPAPQSRAVESLVKEETADAITRMEIEGSSSSRMPSGAYSAVLTVIFFAMCKVGVGVLEATGFMSVQSAQATMVAPAPTKIVTLASTPGTYTKEEVRILTSLDARRVELEERARKLDEREMDFTKRDKEFAAKLTQLRELTDSLKGEREKNEKKRNTQLDQLANVYGSMAPQEAATLMEQLDVTIALSLLERMPEKRIGQILALMHPERALAMTRMLSGKAGA